MECGIFVLCTFLCLTFCIPTSSVRSLWPSHVYEFDMPGMEFVSCFIGTCCFLRKQISKDRGGTTFSVTVKKCRYMYCFVGVNKVTRMYEISGFRHGVVEVFGVLRCWEVKFDFWSHHWGSSSPDCLTSEDGLLHCPKTLITSYHPLLCNIPGDERPHHKNRFLHI